MAGSTFVYLFSEMHGEPDMRAIPVVISASAAGAVGGAVVSRLDPLGKPRGWRRTVSLALSVSIYVLAVIAGFIAGRLGPF